MRSEGVAKSHRAIDYVNARRHRQSPWIATDTAVEEVRAFWDGPLVLSGAVANGRAVLAAEVLGCDFAYAGTLFIPSEEAIAPDPHKQMITRAEADGIVYTPMFSGTHANYLAESVTAVGVALEEARRAVARPMTSKDDPDRPKAWKDVYSAGQAVGQSRAIEPAADIVARLAREYGAACAKVTARSGEESR